MPAKYLKDLLEHTSLIAYLKHADGKYIYVNHMYEAVARVPSKKIIGRYDRDIFPEPVARLFTEQDRKVIEKGAPIEFDETIPLPDGMLSFITAKFPLFDAAGKVWAVGGVCTNVTGLKKAQEELRHSQERFQALIDNAWDGVMIVARDGLILYHTPSARHILGYQAEEVVGRPIWEFLEPADRSALPAALQALLRDPGLEERRELRLRHKDGSWRTVEGVACNLLDNLHIQGIVINYHDVTARRLAEDHLIESERLYRALVETTNTGYVVVDCEGNVVDANPEYVRLSGHRNLEDIRGRSVLDWTAPHDKKRNAEAVADCFKNGFVRNLEIDYIDKQGEITPIEINATVVKMGEKPLIMTICRDISSRRQAQETLRRSEAMLAEAERLAGVGSFDRDILTGKLHRSDGFLCIFGVKRQDMSSSPDGFLAYIHEDDRERIRDSMVKCVTEGTPLREESCVCRPDGTQRIIHAEGKVTKDAAGRPIRFLGWIQDITERKQAEEALLRSKSSLNRAELLAGMGSFDCDIAADRVIRSDGIYSLFGASLEEMGDRPEGFLKQVHPEDRTWVRRSLLKSLREGSPFQDEYRIIRGDGIQRTVHAEGEVSKDAQGRPLRFFGWLQDITERRALEEKVLQISDRERRSIGHDLHDDLGQQLTGITLLGKALQERLAAQASPEAGAMAELLKHVDNALARVREMSRSLESVPPRPEGLFEALSGLAAHVSSTARISCQLKAGRHIMVESQNVANHLYRIAQEAVHNAVRHGGPKAITISLAQRDEGLTLTVADDGAGLLDASKKASGMGLDIMRHRANIIHGTLTISSHAGGGTEVICRVPAGTPDDGGGE